MHYLVQENLFTERNYYLILDYIKKIGSTYDIVSIIPFTDDIKKRVDDEFVDFEIDSKNIFCFGSVKFAHISAKKGWHPGSMFNDSHDFSVYSKYYGENLLNYNNITQKLSDEVPHSMLPMFFARPCKDTKIFSGGVFLKDSWVEMVDHILTNKNRDISSDEVMFSTLKNIAYETRCWIVNGKVVTMSEYKRGRHVIYNNVDDNLILKEKVQKLVDIYQPAKAFVMDVCELVENPDELKIVEINCINCSGFYNGDMLKVLDELELNFNI